MHRAPLRIRDKCRCVTFSNKGGRYDLTLTPILLIPLAIQFIHSEMILARAFCYLTSEVLHKYSSHTLIEPLGKDGFGVH